MNERAYAYNWIGTGQAGLASDGAGGRLGLGPYVPPSTDPAAVGMRFIPEATVLVPSEMVAIGDAYDEPLKHMKPSRFFGQGDDALIRLNNDHQPHRELLESAIPLSLGPTVAPPAIPSLRVSPWPWRSGWSWSRRILRNCGFGTRARANKSTHGAQSFEADAGEITSVG